MLPKYQIYRNAARLLRRSHQEWGEETESEVGPSVMRALRDSLPYRTINPFLPPAIMTDLRDKMMDDPYFSKHYLGYFASEDATPHQEIKGWFSHLAREAGKDVIRFLQELADAYRDPQTQVSVVATEGLDMVDGRPQDDIRPQDTPPNLPTGQTRVRGFIIGNL